jgi:hypothetical protein
MDLPFSPELPSSTFNIYQTSSIPYSAVEKRAIWIPLALSGLLPLSSIHFIFHESWTLSSHHLGAFGVPERELEQEVM